MPGLQQRLSVWEWYGVMRSQDMHQQVQEIQELLSETDDQKTDEAQASGAEGVEEEKDDPEVTPEATPQLP